MDGALHVEIGTRPETQSLLWSEHQSKETA